MSGYHFLFVPGPSNVPAAVQQAIHCPMEDHRNPTIPDLIQPITQDLKKILTELNKFSTEKYGKSLIGQKKT